MGTNKIKYFVLLLFFCTSLTFAQAEYVPSDHSVYEFLNRMDSYHLLNNFNSFERPFTRSQIARHLSAVIPNQNELTQIDRDILRDYITEFEFDLYGNTTNSSSLFSSSGYNFLSQKEKYLYFTADSAGSGLFVNFISSLQNIPYYNYSDETSANASFVQFGGILRGTLLKKFGFMIQGTNGKVWGDRAAALTLDELKFNYKYNLDPNIHTATDFVDNTEGHLSADFENVKIKIGRDKKTVGFGQINYILGSSIPGFDYVSLDLNYKIFTFSYFHGKLLGTLNDSIDVVQGNVKSITDKYIAYHRAGFDISRHFSLGLGEVVIYSNRSIDFSYLNPFNFYKSVEHSNQDRDNSMMFLDIKNNSVKGLKIAGSVLIDDIDFSKAGTGWFGNQLLYNLSIYSSNLNQIIPLDIALQYIRIEPYVFTHRIHNNSYTHNYYSLTNPIQPNSEIFSFRLNYRPSHRVFLNLDITFMDHGANILGADGTIIKNAGGDALVGHREFDPTNAPFMDGYKENYRNVTFDAVFEPYNNYFISGRLNYQNNSLQFEDLNFLAAYIVFDIRI